MTNVIERASAALKSGLGSVGESLATSGAKLLAISLTTIAVSSSAVAASGAVASSYPYSNAYFATITVRMAHVTATTPKLMEMPGLPGRENVPLFEGKQKVEVTVFTQPKPAPLMYVIPGLGGNAMDGATQFLGERYYNAGFNVLIMPSPFYWKFVLGQSTSGLPGFTPADVQDLSRLMLASRTRAQRELGMQPTRAAVVGYSLGAIESAYLLKLDRTTHALGLERATMINPPLALAHAIGVLDQLNSIGDQWSADQRNLLWGSVINGGQALLARNINAPGYFDNLDKVLVLNDTQLKYLIGNTFRQTLTDVVFISQQLNDAGLLKQPATAYRRNARYSEAGRFDFTQYLNTAVVPFWQKTYGSDFTAAQLISRGEIATLRSSITKDSGFRMVHNADDYLNNPALIKAWVKEMGPRAVLFPHGGHCGNLWSPDLTSAVVADAQDLLN